MFVKLYGQVPREQDCHSRTNKRYLNVRRKKNTSTARGQWGIRIRGIHAYQNMLKLLSGGLQSPTWQVQQRQPRTKTTSLNHDALIFFFFPCVFEGKPERTGHGESTGNQVATAVKTVKNAEYLCWSRSVADNCAVFVKVQMIHKIQGVH